MPNVAVSNQDTVVTTDASGAFRMSSRRHGRGIRIGAGWLPRRRQLLARGGTAPHRLAFGLAQLPQSAGLTFVHASDTHISPASLARTQRLRAVVDSLHPDFLIITGDLVRDALRVPEAEATGYYELFAREKALFRTPVVTVPGNHENFGIERDSSHVSASHPLYGRAMYHHYFGPDYYSFTRGGIHFIGLNTVDIDDQHYYGHVDSLQLAWLERDLALVPPAMPVVTFDHIPFFTTFEALNGYDDKSVAPTFITINGKTSFRHTVQNAGAVLAVLRKRQARARARRAHSRDGAHPVRDRRREYAIQSDLGDDRGAARCGAAVRLGRDALPREQRRDRRGDVRAAGRSTVIITRRIRLSRELKDFPLVVEVLSPSTARWDRVKKRRLYREERIPEYWIVDLDARVIERSTLSSDGAEVASEQLVWAPEGSEEPLTIDVERYFGDVLDD